MTTSLPEDRLALIRQRFVARARMDLALIEEFQSRPDAILADQLRQQVHKIAGIAAMLDYEGASRAALAIDASPSIWPLTSGMIEKVEVLRLTLQKICDDAGCA